MSSYSQFYEQDRFMYKAQPKSIADINSFTRKEDTTCVTVGTTVEFIIGKNGCYYEGCSRCTRRRHAIENDGPFKCKCEKYDEHSIPRYKLEIKVIYKGDRGRFVFWNTQATEQDRFMYKAQPKSIADINNFTSKEDTTCVSVGTTVEFVIGKNGWYYEGCSSCTRRRPEIENDGPFKYENLSKVLYHYMDRYKLEIEVVYKGDSRRFVLWDTQAAEQDRFMYKAQPKSIADINSFTSKEDTTCVTVGTTVEFIIGKNGWYYEGCSSCTRRRPEIENDGPFKCKFEKYDEHSVPRYKLEIKVVYKGDSGRFVVWDT